jgi:hypothetical protein
MRRRVLRVLLLISLHIQEISKRGEKAEGGNHTNKVEVGW